MLYKKRKIWKAFNTPKKSVLLIDEIDKADIEFQSHYRNLINGILCMKQENWLKQRIDQFNNNLQ